MSFVLSVCFAIVFGVTALPLVCLPVCSYCVCVCVVFFLFFLLMIRRPPRSTLDRSSAASDVYKRQPQQGRGRLKKGASFHVRVSLVVFLDGVFTAAGRARGVSSVSSTHLRAPETVLDLACRLFLSKKKKTYNGT